MNTTDNFNLKVYEGTDLFNPLTVENANTEAIDEQLYNNEVHGIQPATELLSGTVHAITRTVPDASVFKFTAVSRFTAGDTFTVDGTQVSALTTSGEQLPDGAFVIGSEVIGSLKGTLITFFISAGRVATAQDSEKLGGELPEYYATAEDCTAAQNTATAAGTLAGQNQTAINTLSENLSKQGVPTLLWSKDNETSGFSAETLSLDVSKYNHLLFKLRYSTGQQIYCYQYMPIIAGAKSSLLTNYHVNFHKNVTISSDKKSLLFETSIGYLTYNNIETYENNNFCIPIEIWGIK